ncbi:MAG: hypothetical protein ACK4G3_07370 [bacterium]
MKIFYDDLCTRDEKKTEALLFLFATPFERTLVVIGNILLIRIFIFSASRSSGVSLLLFPEIIFRLLLCTFLLIPALSHPPMKPESSRSSHIPGGYPRPFLFNCQTG